MTKYVATIILHIDEKLEGSTPDVDMIKKYFNNKIMPEIINEVLYKGKVSTRIKDVQVTIMKVE